MNAITMLLAKGLAVAFFFLAIQGCNSISTKVDQPRVHLVNIYEPEPRGGAVRVSVRDAQGPVVLALVSAEPTVWVISVEKDVRLREVILQGGPRGPSRVTGLPADVPMRSEIIGASSEFGDYGYKLAIHYVKERYGVSPASYQIKYSGRHFEVK